MQQVTFTKRESKILLDVLHYQKLENIKRKEDSINNTWDLICSMDNCKPNLIGMAKTNKKWHEIIKTFDDAMNKVKQQTGVN